MIAYFMINAFIAGGYFIFIIDKDKPGISPSVLIVVVLLLLCGLPWFLIYLIAKLLRKEKENESN